MTKVAVVWLSPLVIQVWPAVEGALSQDAPEDDSGGSRSWDHHLLLAGLWEFCGSRPRRMVWEVMTIKWQGWRGTLRIAKNTVPSAPSGRDSQTLIWDGTLRPFGGSQSWSSETYSGLPQVCPDYRFAPFLEPGLIGVWSEQCHAGFLGSNGQLLPVRPPHLGSREFISPCLSLHDVGCRAINVKSVG